jgi:hypothetical protein
MSKLERLIFAVMFALLAAGVTLAAAQAQTPQPQQPTNSINGDSCVACHKDIYDTWQGGAHGQSLTDPVFAESWNAQGKPGACLVCHATGYDPATGESEAEGVVCTACHSPIAPNHPTDNMPIDASPDLCGKCHSDPRFATENWMLSAHYQRSMTCAIEESGGTPTPLPAPVATPIPLVTNQPVPVSPFGFAGLAALLGLVGGMVLSPWLERLYRHLNNKEGREK